MELQTCLATRRSIRRFQPTPVSRETIRELIVAANLAPSWKNSQTGRYYVADGKAKEAMAELLPQFNQNATKDAPVLIVATAVKGISGFTADGGYATHLKEGFQCFDNGLQVENLCLKAWDLGLGTLIMGLYDEAAIRDFFPIPESEEIVCVIALGYPDIEPKAPQRLPVDTLVTFKD